MTRIFIKNHRAPRLLQIVALFIFIFPITQSGWAQSHAQIRNVDFTVRNDSLFVTYDLDKATKQERFTISLKISTPSGKITTPYTLSGDVGEQIPGGQNKLIIWNIGKDNIVINEEITLEMIWYCKQPKK